MSTLRALFLRTITLGLPLFLCSCGPAGIIALATGSSGGGGGGSSAAAQTATLDTFLAPSSIPALATNQTSATFVFSASSVGVSFEASLDGGAFQPAVSPLTYSGLAEGPHEFRVRALDAEGEKDSTPAIATWTVDTTPPTSSFTSVPTPLTRFLEVTFAFTASESEARFEGRLDGVAWIPVESPYTTPTLFENSHTFELRAFDRAGNQEMQPITYSWTTDATAPSATIDFPPPSALTTIDTVEVIGQANDPNGVSAVTLNGTPTMTSNDFVDWQLMTALSPGAQDLIVGASDVAGNEATTAATARVTRTSIVIRRPIGVSLGTDGARLVLDAEHESLLATGNGSLVGDPWLVVSGPGVGQGVPLRSIFGLAFNAVSGRALVTTSQDNALLEVDLATGDRTVVTSDSVGSGPNLALPWSVAVSAGGDFAVVGCAANGTLVSVNLTTGNRTLVSGAGQGSGPSLGFPRAVAIEEGLGRVITLDGASGSLLSVALTGGNREMRSSDTVGTGPPFGDPSALALDATQSRAFVTDANVGALVEVDLVTGNRTIISDSGLGSGPAILSPTGMVHDPTSSSVWISDSTVDGVIQIDLNTGNRVYTERSSLGTGAAFLEPVAVAETESMRFAIDKGRRALVSIDRSTSARSEVSGPGRGTGPALSRPEDLEIDTVGSRAIVVDSGMDAVIGIDLVTGNRTELSGPNVGGANLLITPLSVALDPATNSAFVLDAPTTSVIEVNLTTGVQQVISGGVIGSGPALSVPRDLAVDTALGVAYVVDFDLQLILAIDLMTGARSLINTVGVSLQLPSSVALDPIGNRLFISGSAAATVYSVNLATGLVSTVTDATMGSGPLITAPGRLTISASGMNIALADPGRGAIFAIDPVSGARVITSK